MIWRVMSQYILRNCIWLWVPPLAISFLIWPYLDAAYQPDLFWRDIPRWLGMSENVLRVAVIAVAGFMPLHLSTRRARLGAVVYGVGLIVYAASQITAALLPDSAWAVSVLGFAAPAYTTFVWLLGIGMIGDRLFWPQIPWHRWAYAGLATAFVILHTSHTALVCFRVC